MKKKVKILQSIAGTGDPSPAELDQKYAALRRMYLENSRAAQNMGKQGRSLEEITRLVDEERKKDAQIPRLSGFTAPFAFKPGDEVSIDAELAEKWEQSGICVILPAEKKTAA